MHREARAAELAQVPLFTRCSNRELKQLARESHVETIDPGQALFRQGAPSPQMYVILAGRAHVERNGHPVDDVQAGDVLGELGLLSDEVRNATIYADTALEVLSLDRAGLRRALEQVPGLAWTLLTTVAERLRRVQTST